MKTLTLSIENHANLESGGPVTLTLKGKGAQIGRKPGNDWVLPDPSRHISGHHFDVSYERDAYVLTDVSSNGTFLQGERYRLGGSHTIADGDRFTVGQYIIRATLLDDAPVEAEQPAPAAPAYGDPMTANAPQDPAVIMTPPQTQMPPVAQPPADDFDDIWGDLGDVSSQPSQAENVQAPPPTHVLQPGGAPHVQAPGQGAPGLQTGVTQPDFSGLGDSRGVAMPPMGQPAAPVAAPPQTQVPPAPDPAIGGAVPGAPMAQQPPAHAPTSPQTPPLAPPPPQPTPIPQTPMPPVAQAHALGESFSDPVADMPAPTVNPSGQGAGDAFLQAFLQAAGIDASRIKIPPEELGRMMGEIARTGTQELMRMLQERSAVKVFVASEDRTLRVATGNNPMKFELDPNRAFDMLFVEPRDGYQTGGAAFANALEDVRRHQAAVMASVQPGLAEMLEGLSPSEIEKESGGGMFSGGGRKAWEEYTKRWDSRAAQGDNGMLDAFIKAFGRHYGDALRKL